MSSIAAPFYKLLRKDQEWRWEDAEEKAFQRLKEMMSELPELGYPDSNLPYEVHCDATNTGIGAVLVQMGRPIAFASKSLSSAQRNYSTTERECLAAAWALQHFHCYVHGCASLTVYTDHAASKAILSTKDPKGIIARWIMDIASYEFTVFRKKGVDNADADALSRIKRQYVKINQQGVAEDFTLTNIARLQNEDLELKKYVSRSASKSLVEMNSIWYHKTKQGRLVVYLPKKLRNGYLWLIHAHPTSGHMGRDKSIDKACENAWWPDMVKDVENFVKTCETCLRHKAPTHKFVELKSIEISEPGEVWAADVAFLPESTRGNKYLLVFMDYLTKWVVTAAIPHFDTNTVANVLLYSVVLVYGVPKKWITDNGKNFISETMRAVCQRLDVKKVETSVEHPQSDGLVERMNRTLKTSLATYVENQPEAWDTYSGRQNWSHVFIFCLYTLRTTSFLRL